MFGLLALLLWIVQFALRILFLPLRLLFLLLRAIVHSQKQ